MFNDLDDYEHWHYLDNKGNALCGYKRFTFEKYTKKKSLVNCPECNNLISQWSFWKKLKSNFYLKGRVIKLGNLTISYNK